MEMNLTKYTLNIFQENKEFLYLFRDSHWILCLLLE